MIETAIDYKTLYEESALKVTSLKHEIANLKRLIFGSKNERFHSSRTLRSLELKFEKYDLVICDEFGYISFGKQGSEMHFNHLSLRTGIKSTIITSNLSFDKWNDIFGKDTVLTAALLDRLTHKAYLVNMNAQSYRMKETKKIQDSIKIKAA